MTSATRATSGVACPLTQSKHNFVPLRHSRSELSLLLSCPMDVLQRRPRRHKQEVQRSTAVLQQWNPAHSSTRTHLEVSQSIRVWCCGHRSSCQELQPCSPPSPTTSAFSSLPRIPESLTFSRCLFFSSLPICSGSDEDIVSPLCHTCWGQTQVSTLLETTLDLQKL